jgi:hypothetical protein
MGNADVFIKANKCIKRNCSDTNDKIKAIKNECYGNKKPTVQATKCYLNKVVNTKLFDKQTSCIKKNCKKEKDALFKFTIKNLFKNKKGGNRKSKKNL